VNDAASGGGETPLHLTAFQEGAMNVKVLVKTWGRCERSKYRRAADHVTYIKQPNRQMRP